MGNIKERVAYLHGLTKGLNVSGHSAEGKLLLNMVDVLNDMAEELDCLHVVQEDLENYVETIDDDLADLEDEVYEDIDDADLIEMECPSCHETVAFEADLIDEDEDAVEVTCPNCGAVVYESLLIMDDNDSDEQIVFHRGVHPGL